MGETGGKMAELRKKCAHIKISNRRLWYLAGILTLWTKLRIISIYNRNTAWLRDTVRQTSRGKSAAAGQTTGAPRQLTSQGTSAWPYCVATQYSFYPVQYIVNITKMKLWNHKSNDLLKNGLPMRAWRRQPSHQLDKVSEGRRLEHLLNNPGTVLNLQFRPSIYMGLIISEMCNKSLLYPTKNLSIGSL